MRNVIYILMVIVGLFYSCNSDEGSKLPSAEDRKIEAIEELVDELTDPVNGWKLEYRPNTGNGAYLILLDFKEDGVVTVHSDVVDGDEGDFFQQELRYRVDASLEIELVMETYGVFHYLFEQQNATFGGEFVFAFLEEDGGNLFFESKSDVIDKTVLEFIPAQAGDIELFSTDLAENLQNYSGSLPKLFGGVAPIQHLALTDEGISIFWSMDLLQRIITVDIAAVGVTLDDVLLNNNNVIIDHNTGYTIQNGKVILDEAFSFTLNGVSSTISEVSLSNFGIESTSFCPSVNLESPLSTGNITGLGAVEVSKTLFNSEGYNFTTMSDEPYSINPFFIADGNGFSLLQGGIIGEKFPDAASFLFNYGLIDENEPSDAVGFIITGDSGPPKTYLRELSSVVKEGNKLMLELANSFYYSETPAVNDEQHLIDITNEIFEGGTVYIFDLPQEGGKVFRLYNPCNQYEVFLVQ